MICSGAFSRVSASENSEAFGDAQRHPQTADEVLIFQTGLSADQVAWVYRDIDQKRATTRALHLSPVLCGAVDEIVL